MVDVSNRQPPSTRRRTWRTVLAGIAAAWDRLGCWLANRRRRMLRGHLPDYVVITLDHAISERAPDVPWWYAYLPGLKLPLSLEYLHDALRRIAVDPDVRGVVFLMKGPGLSLSQAQSLAQLFDRFRTWDQVTCRPAASRQELPPKQIVVHLEQIGSAAYVVACAADRVTMPPLSTWDLMGLRVAPTYWQETLTRLGIQFDVVKIAPWKTAADSLSRSTMSDAEREQYNWLLDSLADDIVCAISKGRGLDEETVRGLIDQAPLFGEQALAAGLVDDLAYEDQLADLLRPATTHAAPDSADKKNDKPAKLKPYSQVRGLLYHRPRRRGQVHNRRIGVLSLKGTIVTGNSRTFPVPLPLLGENTLGSSTVEQQIRAARRDKQLAALVIHIDSGGGSGIASDLMWREIELLGQEKPVIVYMGNVAASGGYYIAAPAHKIIAQSATLTGSIGVIIAKGVTTGLRDKIGAHREVIRRGENAGLYTDDALWDVRQREQVEASIHHFYHAFKQRVAAGRGLPYDELDAICNGRVWTGRQAHAHGLIDEVGDFMTAYRHACRAAGLPDDGSVKTKRLSTPHTRLMAQPVEPAQVPAHLLGHSLPVHWAAELLRGDWLHLLQRDPIWFITPDLPRLD